MYSVYYEASHTRGRQNDWLCLGLHAESDSRSYGGRANSDLGLVTVDVVIVYSWSSARREVCSSCLLSLESMRLRVQ